MGRIAFKVQLQKDMDGEAAILFCVIGSVLKAVAENILPYDRRRTLLSPFESTAVRGTSLYLGYFEKDSYYDKYSLLQRDTEASFSCFDAATATTG